MKPIWIAGGAAAALALTTAAVWWTTRTGGDDRFAECRTSQIAGGAAAIGGDFELVSETGETVTQADVLDRPSLVYFGYTFCPDVCPLDAARNAEVADLVAAQGHDVQPVFITIDPERDTPEVLAEFTDYLHPQMLGLTGSAEQVARASKAYKTYYAKRATDDPDWYLMDHSVFTYLVLPDHGFVEFFRGAPNGGSGGVEAEEMAQTVACFLERA
ncbi:SCO family protein [Rhodobacteraceae bacterium CCMM004]|nr:SCO family protein [Rhodobacteraceae bacterium CCMM004]